MNVQTEPRLRALNPQLEQKLAEAMERLKVPGVSIGIYHRGEEDYIHRGVTSIDNPLEVNGDTLFQIGSTTKTYTATAAMILVEEGKLDLDAPVRQYIPEFRLKDASVADRVTVLQLLNHTGGWEGDVFTDTGDGDDYLEKYVELLVELDQVNPLGKFASYNNAAFVVAGLVVQRVAGKRYEDAIRELVFEPLAMKDSFLFPREVMTRRFAVGHGDREGVLKVTPPWALPRSANPPGGIISTAADQVRYARFHLGDGAGARGKRLLSAETLKRMQQPTAELRGGALGDHVGISWLLRDIEGTRVVAHGGTTNGQLSAFELVPEHDFGLTILTNSERGGALHHELSEWIREVYLGVKAKEEVPLDLSDDELAKFNGEYDNRNAIIRVEVDHGRLKLKATYTDAGRQKIVSALGQDPPDPKPMFARLLSDTRYVVSEGDAKDMKGSFILDEAGRVTALELGGRLATRIS